MDNLNQHKEGKDGKKILGPKVKIIVLTLLSIFIIVNLIFILKFYRERNDKVEIKVPEELEKQLKERQEENTYVQETLLLKYLQTGKRQFLEQMLEKCEQLSKKCPLFSFNNYLRIYGYGVLGNNDKAEQIRQKLNPLERETYRFFFGAGEQELASYLETHLRVLGSELFKKDFTTAERGPMPYHFPCFYQVAGRCFSHDRLNFVLGKEQEALVPFDVLFDFLEIKKGMKVADIGCGPGLFVFPLAERVGPEGKVYAVEIEQCYLDFINEVNKNLKYSNIVTVLSSPNDIKVEAKVADYILIFNVYGDISQCDMTENPKKFEKMAKPFLLSVHRGLKDTGRMVIMFDEYYPNPDCIIKEAEHCGFKLAKEIAYFKDKQSTLIFTKK